MCLKKIEWSGEGLDEIGSIDGKVVVRIHPKYFRPAEVELLLGNSEKAYNELGWFPKYSTAETLREMVLSDYKNIIFKNHYENLKIIIFFINLHFYLFFNSIFSRIVFK